MIKIERMNVSGWEAAVRGMRNPMNSWDKSDSSLKPIILDGHFDGVDFILGDNDYDLMMRLAKAGSDHAKYRRMIIVTCDITAPLYWWKEFDTYKVGTVANSCSTMHKIHVKEFTRDDFSHEHLHNNWENSGTWKYCLEIVIAHLNHAREKYLETGCKGYWWQMIQLLPSSYNQKRTVQLNYEVLNKMYAARKNHKLDEWRKFCECIESLPYSRLITGDKDNDR